MLGFTRSVKENTNCHLCDAFNANSRPIKRSEIIKNIFHLISRQTLEDVTKRQDIVPFKNDHLDFVYPKHKIIGVLSWHK